MNINKLEEIKQKVIKLEKKTDNGYYQQCVRDVLDIIDEDIIFIQERIINGD